MEILGGLQLILWLLVIPTCLGGIPTAFVDKYKRSPAFMCITGYIFMWAVFQVICVPFVLLEGRYNGMFPYVVKCFGAAAVLLAVLGCVVWYRRVGTFKAVVPGEKELPGGEELSGNEKCLEKEKQTRKHIFLRKEIILWMIVWLLILLQLVMSVVYTYGDGDDAFYVAVSTITESSNTLYKLMPYNVGATGLDIRHGLAPFPIWIAFLARISGLKVAFVAHVAAGTFLIGLSYMIFYKLGQALLGDKKESLPVFMLFVELLVLFGDYSFKTAENFMIARSRQGKAALGNIIIPLVILLFILILEQVQKQKKAEWMLWVLLFAAVTAACLCSTLGTMLMCMLLGVTGLCAGVSFRSVRLVINMALCCVPALLYAVMYFVLG